MPYHEHSVVGPWVLVNIARRLSCIRRRDHDVESPPWLPLSTLSRHSAPVAQRQPALTGLSLSRAAWALAPRAIIARRMQARTLPYPPSFRLSNMVYTIPSVFFVQRRKKKKKKKGLEWRKGDRRGVGRGQGKPRSQEGARRGPGGRGGWGRAAGPPRAGGAAAPRLSLFCVGA